MKAILKQSAGYPLIRTKINKPRLTTDHVLRPHLVEKLNSGLDRKLTLVSAPAGFGKTILVLSWLEICERPSFWLSLDENDNNLSIFLSYFIAAVRTRYSQACDGTSDLLEADRMPPPDYVATSLVNDIVDIHEPFIFVLDDYHLIHDETIQQLITSLVKTQPEQLHLVIISRSDPLLPLPSLRANRLMTEIRTNELRFSEQEAELFFQRAVDKRIDHVTAIGLHQRTEGWVVGLRLAALSLQAGTDHSAILDSFRGDTSEFVTDYLISEVLDHQPAEMRKFLLKTSILDRFNPDLCETVSSSFTEKSNSSFESDSFGLSASALLSKMKNMNLFLIPLDTEQNWYRYHPLFQEVLRSRLLSDLSHEQVKTLHCRASNWLMEHGYREEAIQHALAANDINMAVNLVEDQSQNLLNPVDRFILERWLSLLPQQVIWRRPKLQITRAWILFRQWNITTLDNVLDRTETLLSEDTCTNDEKEAISGQINTLRSATQYLLHSEYQRVLDISETGLQQLPESARDARSIALMLRSLSHQALGRRNTAIRDLEQIIADPSPQGPAKTQAYLTLALLHFSAGDLINMERVTSRMLSFADQNKDVNAIPGANYTAGFLHYEWNDLDAAEVHFQRVFELRYRTNFMGGISGGLGLIRINQLRSQLDESQELIDILRADTNKIMNTDLLPLVEAAQAMQDMLQGDQAAALRWARSSGTEGLDDKTFIFELPFLIQTRILVELGTTAEIQRLRTRLQELSVDLETYHFTHRFVQILTHLVLVNERLGNTTEAFELLQRAVDLAQPGGFVRSFVDVGPSILPLLEQVQGHHIAPDYTAQLLAAFEMEGAANLPEKRASLTGSMDESGLLEPLTQREEDVLYLMMRGLMNKEIANELVISPHTVRAHATNIYAKLGVSNRARAVHKARQLNILPIER